MIAAQDHFNAIILSRRVNNRVRESSEATGVKATIEVMSIMPNGSKTSIFQYCDDFVLSEYIHVDDHKTQP